MDKKGKEIIMSGKPTLKTIQKSIDSFRSDYKEAVTKFQTSVTTLQADIIAIKETVIKNLLEENKRLKERVHQLEIGQDDNLEYIIEVEKQSQNLEQYTRRNNLEINGIPNTIADENLESKCIEILGSVDIHVEKSDIEACHRLPTNNKNKKKPKAVIIKFTNRKHVEEACSKNHRGKLKNCDKVALGFTENTDLYFNENLSPYFQHLSWMCRVLKRKKLISGTWFRDSKLFYKISDNTKPIKVVHPSELTDDFPEVIFDD